MDTKKNTRFPLQVTISALFISLSILLGALLSLHNYNKASDILLTSAHEVYDRLAEELVLDIKGTYITLAGVLKMIAISPVTTANTLEERLEHLEAFSIALINHPAAANLYIGYANGDFFSVRRINNDDLKNRFKAPGDAMYVVDNIDMSPTGIRRLTRLFYNKKLESIAREPAIDADYDPRLRNWYIGATSEPAATTPYLFYFSGNVGITAKLKSREPGVVIATDITLDRLADTINKYQRTPSSAAVLINAENQVFAYKDPDSVIIKDDGKLRLASMDQLGSDVLTYLSNNLKAEEQDLEFDFGNKQWTGSMRLVARPGGVDLFAVMISPVDELLSEAAEIRTQSFTATIIISLAFIPLIWLVSKRISTPLRKLADAASEISQFEFDTPIDTKSHIKEVHELSTTMELMKTTINRFINLINSLAGEQNLDALLQSISRETMLISNADGVLTYLMNDHEDALDPGIICSSNHDYLDTGQLPSITADDKTHVELFSKKRSSVLIIDETADNTFKPLLRLFETDHLTMIALPLLNRNYEHIGLLCLLFKQAERLNTESEQASLSFIQALSGFAAVTLESRQLLHMQEALLNSFIKLIAGAIDSKSPYTGGHCQRVPEITRMLAQAACASDEQPFDDFDMTDKEWEVLDIASWLHDCGKVTTPEYVVDKATKLETIYDRIHEIRMRFEVLKRDAEIMYWQQLVEGGDKEVLQQSLSARLQQLDDDFAFIAECNEGGEFMDDEKIERLNRIAQQTWKRTLDDRIGISWEEANRKSKTESQPLPVAEHLLADKPEHVIERQERDRIPADNPWGFRLDVPEHKYNRGELYNLSVRKGTLSAEERYKINDHMTQTIIMLEQLPYPKHLRDVPKIAGSHHETMDGKGYPKRLSRDDMSLTARMMAIADIFEALTASDRPYKKAKTLSEAIRIMSYMRNDNHIDADLFKLFLTSGVYKKYAERFLDPEQIDDVDINDYL
ncbi:MAG: HD domain-containing phosphohydrolase [Gammaproteobacteria bacterium]|jgi:HD-GYP domain-containing protein (c-di-GMP phosphodiesterase class II)/HAMP domain-containing protein